MLRLQVPLDFFNNAKDPPHFLTTSAYTDRLHWLRTIVTSEELATEVGRQYDEHDYKVTEFGCLSQTNVTRDELVVGVLSLRVCTRVHTCTDVGVVCRRSPTGGADRIPTR